MEEQSKLTRKLPSIAREALKSEDKMTRSLASSLLDLVYKRESDSNLQKLVNKTLDDELGKMISGGLFDIDDFQEN